MKKLQNLASQIISNNHFKDKTIVISGASRGIGLAIAKICGKDGANIAILAKSVQQNPKLPGTIFTAAKQIQQLGGKCLPLACDIRNESKVQLCIKQVIQKFGKIDILINNASAISQTSTADTSIKKYDLMHQINIRGTFLLSKLCLPYLKKSSNPHILNLAPPFNMNPKWFAPHLAYTMSKYGMSMCVLGMAEQFRQFGIAVNALWPRTFIATAAVKNLLGGDNSIKKSRNPQIIADAAYLILSSDSKKNTGNFYIDEEILREYGIIDFSKYRVDQSVRQEQLLIDLFIQK